MFDVSNWVASLNGENGPRGTTSHEILSVSHQGALEISSTTGQPPSLDRSHLCTPGLVAESCKRDERLRPSSQRPQYPTLYRRLQRRLGRSFRTKFYSRSVVSPGKRATHKRPRIESCLSGPETLQRPVSGPNSASCDGQLNCGSLHKPTRRNTPWFWDQVQLSTEIPLQLPVPTTLLKQSHNYMFQSNPQHLNLHAWCLGVDNSKNKASLWR